MSLENVTEEQISKWNDDLMRFASRFANRDESEDLVQEVWLKLLTHPDFDPNRSDCGSYMYTTMKRTFIDRLRRKNYFVDCYSFFEDGEVDFFERLPSSDLSPQDVSEYRQILACVDEAVMNLPDNQKKVFLGVVVGMSYNDLAAYLNIPLGTMKHLLYRARQNIRESIPQEFIP